MQFRFVIAALEESYLSATNRTVSIIQDSDKTVFVHAGNMHILELKGKGIAPSLIIDAQFIIL